MTVQDLVSACETIAPAGYAESWDNVGLLVGFRDAPLKGPVLLTIDLTERVMDEAEQLRAAAIVAYHPPIWTPLRRITGDDPRQRVLLRAARAGLSVYAPHTALDAAPGGVTDWLCDGLFGEGSKVSGDRRALVPLSVGQERVKIVTFVPEGDADRVRDALASAGAGRIGRYDVCSFGVTGTGTFLGLEGSRPSVGAPGTLERVPERRLEMVCPRAALALAVELLRRFHPYEEPAVDIYPLEPEPRRGVGAGRRVVLDRPATLSTLAARLKSHLKISAIRVANARATDEPVTHVGVCPGSGSGLAQAAAANDCHVYVTGEMKHHEVLEALHAGMSVITAGHTNTERGYLPRLAERLNTLRPGLHAVVSRADRSPFETV